MNRSRNTFLRSVLLGLGLVAFLAGMGWVVQERFVAPPAASPGERHTPPAPAPTKPAPAPAVDGTVAIVLDVDGSVERGQGQAWRPLRVGDRLSQSESIRANAGAQAELRVGEDSQVTLFEESEVTLAQVTPDLHALRLKEGRVKLNYPPRQERLLRLETEGGAVAETHGASFTVLRSGIAVAVATEQGAVNLKGAGDNVRIAAGEQSVAMDGEKPSAAAAIPREVLLQVARRASGDKAPCSLVEGHVRPGTEVRVDGMLAEVGRDGRFLARLAAHPGRDGVHVEAREPGGGVKAQRLACPPARGKPKTASPPDDATVKFDWDHAP